MAQPLNILITCVGRRVSLVRHFQRALRAEGAAGRVLGADKSIYSAAMHVVDAARIVPPIDQPGYVDALLDLAAAEGVRLVIPTADFDLQVLSRNHDRFEAAGARLLTGLPATNALCRDKLATYRFFKDRGFPTPRTWPADQLVGRSNAPFPLFIKPRCGSAAKGNFIARTPEQLAGLALLTEDAICQELVHGIEHTLDVFVDFDGAVRCVVPRRRLEVRGGEVTKSRTVRHEGMIAGGRRVVEALGGCLGVVTLQLFLCPDDTLKFIEINPRFGGGVPLSIAAGADFPLWIVRRMLDRNPRIDPTAWEDGLTMLRYDEEVFVSADADGQFGDMQDFQRQAEGGR
jgi:carbamoyl-phosphate synthase large subunit